MLRLGYVLAKDNNVDSAQIAFLKAARILDKHWTIAD